VSTVTKIEWTRSDDGTAGATWNPVAGCTKISEGCDHCYAETFAERWRAVPGIPFEQGFDVRLWPERLTMPLRWRKPRRVFLNSMADLWHDAVDTDLIARVFAVITLAEKHTFQVLTKRPGRMHSLLADDGFWDRVRTVVPDYGPLSPVVESALDTRFLPNLWLGVSVPPARRGRSQRRPGVHHRPGHGRARRRQRLRAGVGNSSQVRPSRSRPCPALADPIR
jgi:hypothetical protein